MQNCGTLINAPVNIPATGGSVAAAVPPCSVKCSYQCSYYNSSCSVINQEYYLSLSYDPPTSSTTNPVIYKELMSHIKKKLYSYNYQDQLRLEKQTQLLNATTTTVDDNKQKQCVDVTATVTVVHCCSVIRMLVAANLQCFYCKTDMLVLYPTVRQHTQWTLDRIDNTKNHTIDNVVVACLQCNVKRNTMHKETFHYTKTLHIIKTPL
jgi:5-methylcytosine-specific restriction endonuclease McrA